MIDAFIDWMQRRRTRESVGLEDSYVPPIYRTEYILIFEAVFGGMRKAAQNGSR